MRKVELKNHPFQSFQKPSRIDDFHEELAMNWLFHDRLSHRLGTMVVYQDRVNDFFEDHGYEFQEPP